MGKSRAIDKAICAIERGEFLNYSKAATLLNATALYYLSNEKPH